MAAPTLRAICIGDPAAGRTPTLISVRPPGPIPACATGRYTIGWIPSRCESNTASPTTPTIVRCTSPSRDRG